MSNFTLIWSFRNRLETLQKSISSADATCPKDVDFVLVDAASSEDTIKQLRTFVNSISDRTVRIVESSYRSGLSEAWNLGMMTTKNRYCIFASSDTFFIKSGWYEVIKECMLSGGQYVLIENHSVFGIDKKAIVNMGWFDEEFKAGPHFDCDYMIRASEVGIGVHSRANAGYYIHEDDAETTKSRLTSDVKDRLPMNDLTNERVFKAKWSSNWPGWEAAIASGSLHLPHPPTHISQVRRNRPETDPHPEYTRKYRSL